jgi:hypothetical protein
MPTVDLEFDAEIQGVSVTAKAKDGVVRRICRVKLAREFDSLIADALGTAAKKAREHLADRSLKQVIIPMDALAVSGVLKTLGGNKVDVPLMRGIKAKASIGKDEDDPVTVKLDFEFDLIDEVWVFLGRNLSAYAQVTLSRLQQSFAYPPAQPGTGVGKGHA